MSPGGNTTILITEPFITDKDERVAIAQELLEEQHLHAEQVGFVSLVGENPKLEMMGGEFCGNAARSMVAFLTLGTSNRESVWRGTIEVSGTDTYLSAAGEKISNASVDAEVQMPIKHSFDTVCLSSWHGEEVAVVAIDGITHVLLDKSLQPFPDNYKEVAAEIRQSLDLNTLPASGCIWFEEKTNGQIAIDPVVWVSGTQTTYYETACGSGTVAFGLYQAWRTQSNISLDILQPSKESISVKVELNEEINQFKNAWIKGMVKVIAYGTTYIYK
ncbi:MAG: hypothetical protein D3918_14150 [Candidatus Electrothrix sp. AX2]|nr:hypothetical protein [Candidatus Electrothrix gigas]